MTVHADPRSTEGGVTGTATRHPADESGTAARAGGRRARIQRARPARTARMRCPVCGFVFTYRYKRESDPRPPTCGFPRCRAINDWSEADWAGLARCARARRAAGVVLSDLDRQALAREAP